MIIIPNNLKNRIESEAKAAMPIKNENLVCNDCVYKFDDSDKAGNVSKCKIFTEVKPTKVLLGKDCEMFLK